MSLWFCFFNLFLDYDFLLKFFYFFSIKFFFLLELYSLSFYFFELNKLFYFFSFWIILIIGIFFDYRFGFRDNMWILYDMKFHFKLSNFWGDLSFLFLDWMYLIHLLCLQYLILSHYFLNYSKNTFLNTS